MKLYIDLIVPWLVENSLSFFFEEKNGNSVQIYCSFTLIGRGFHIFLLWREERKPLHGFTCTLLRRGFLVFFSFKDEKGDLYTDLFLPCLAEGSKSFSGLWREERKLYTDLLVPWLVEDSLFFSREEKKGNSIQIYFYPD
mgnify:CR=1 FL=1